MGIKGLASYVSRNYRLWEHVRLTGRSLVLDGMSMCLSNDSNVDGAYNERYQMLREYYMNFIDAIIRSNIELYVIFDGNDLQKRDITKKRTRKAVHIAFEAIKEGDSDLCKEIPPQFTLMVFCEVLKCKGVPFLFADGDADVECVALANYLCCPVVSNDSDFYMFNIEAGYIPYAKLYWKKEPIAAKIYHFEKFVQKCTNFGLKDIDAVFLIPAIIGNDLISKLNSPCLRGEIAVRLKSFRDGRDGTNSAIDQNHEAIHYIAGFCSFDDVMDRISQVCLGNEYSLIYENFYKAKEMYIVKQCSSFEDLMKTTKLVASRGESICEWPWVFQQFREGSFYHDTWQVIIYSGKALPSVADDPDRPTAWEISKPLRQCIYRVVSPLMDKQTVTEKFRVVGSCEMSTIEVSLANEALGLPLITEVHQQSQNDRIHALCTAMECSPHVLDHVAEEWKLVALASCYWVKRVQPKPQRIKSLLLSFMILSHSKGKALICDTNDKELLHIFAQWKCIYYDTIRLNQVLKLPLPVTCPSLLFDMKLIMQCCDMQCQHLNAVFQKHLSNSSDSRLFEALLSAMTSSINIVSSPACGNATKN